jgi:hypothetical protein
MTDMRTTPWDWNDPTLRLAGQQAVNEGQQGLQQRAMRNPEPTSDVIGVGGTTRNIGMKEMMGGPSPPAIAAFLDTVRRLNNSVDFGEVEPGASVWRWLEQLASE